MSTRLTLLCAVLISASMAARAQATVRVEPTHLDGPRPLQAETREAVIRDYLQSWRSLRAALGQNRADLLNANFVGVAKDRLAATIRQQANLGIRTLYRDRSHDIEVVFYSPDGSAIELSDTAEYDMQVAVHDKIQATQTVRSRYLVLLTPSEVRWRVRVFQAETE